MTSIVLLASIAGAVLIALLINTWARYKDRPQPFQFKTPLITEYLNLEQQHEILSLSAKRLNSWAGHYDSIGNQFEAAVARVRRDEINARIATIEARRADIQKKIKK